MFCRINGVGMTNGFYVPLLAHICQAAVDLVYLIAQVVISRNC